MKKITVLTLALLCLTVAGCKKKSSDATLDNKDLVSEIFRAGMTWNEQTMLLKGTIPYHKDVENMIYGPEGGYIHLIGSVDGQINFDDNTGYILGGFYQIGLTETINDYAFKSNGEVFTSNGAPYISLAGTFTIAPGGASFGTASSIEIGGGVRVTGPNGFDQTINIQLTIIINSDASGGHVSGTIGGEPVDYYF